MADAITSVGLMGLPHFRTSRVSMEMYEPVYQNLFTVEIQLPAKMSTSVDDKNLLLEGVTKVGGLETNKMPETAKQTYESNLTKYNQGRLPELQLLNSQYNYESRIPAVENLKITYQSNLDNFKLILGLGLTDQIELEGSLLDVSKIVLSEDILSYDLNEIPAIKLLLKKENICVLMKIC